MNNVEPETRVKIFVLDERYALDLLPRREHYEHYDVISVPTLAGVPGDVKVERVWHDPMYRGFLIALSHPTFPPVPVGQRPEMIEAHLDRRLLREALRNGVGVIPRLATSLPDDKTESIDVGTVKALFGGRWPDIGFDWREVCYFRVRHGNNTIQGMSGGKPVGPPMRLVFSYPVIYYDDDEDGETVAIASGTEFELAQQVWTLRKALRKACDGMIESCSGRIDSHGLMECLHDVTGVLVTSEQILKNAIQSRPCR